MWARTRAEVPRDLSDNPVRRAPAFGLDVDEGVGGRVNGNSAGMLKTSSAQQLGDVAARQRAELAAFGLTLRSDTPPAAP